MFKLNFLTFLYFFIILKTNLKNINKIFNYKF